MKSLKTSICIALLLAATLFAGNVFRDFAAANSGGQARLEWNVNPGAAILAFNVQRSFDGRRFYDLARIPFTPGQNHYLYLDDDLFKDEIHTFWYRIEAELPNRQVELSSTAEVTLSFSGIRRTWGSIKAMFR
jgi:hypothetical protein